MKKGTLFFSLFILIFCTISCKYSEQPKIFENQNITLEYPSYLKNSKAVFPVENLLLGLKNDYRDVFFILLDYGQKPGINGFEVMFDSLSNQLKNGIREPFIEKDTIFQINQFKTREIHISGIIAATNQEKRMYFVFNIFEDKNGHLYQTSGWCFRHKREVWQHDIQNIAYSLKQKSK
jgi:hypothetical protein